MLKMKYVVNGANLNRHNNFVIYGTFILHLQNLTIKQLCSQIKENCAMKHGFQAMGYSVCM